MNALVRLYPGDDALRLAASVAVQIAGVVLLALAASWTVARRNAALRDAIWQAALALVCVAPVAAWGFQHAGITVWRTPAVAPKASESAQKHPRVTADVAPIDAARVTASDEWHVDLRKILTHNR